MFRFLILISTVFFLNCTTNLSQNSSYRDDFSVTEQKIIINAKIQIENTYYTTLITVDEKGQPRARVMETFEPEKDFVIWMGTNPKSRKVQQIKKNSKATMHFFDRSKMGYVSLMGNAFIVNDNEIKSQKWKKAWEQFYKNQTDDYMLIKFIPETLELIGMVDGFTGDSLTWAPHKVVLRK